MQKSDRLGMVYSLKRKDLIEYLGSCAKHGMDSCADQQCHEARVLMDITAHVADDLFWLYQLVYVISWEALTHSTSQPDKSEDVASQLGETPLTCCCDSNFVIDLCWTQGACRTLLIDIVIP